MSSIVQMFIFDDNKLHTGTHTTKAIYNCDE